MAQQAHPVPSNANIPYGQWLVSQLLDFPSSPPAYGLGKRQRWSKSLEPYTHVEDPEEVSDSWLQRGSSVAIPATWEVS